MILTELSWLRIGFCENGNEPFNLIKDREFVDQLSVCGFLK